MPAVYFSQISEAVSGLGEDASIDVYVDGLYVGSLTRTTMGSLWSGKSAHARLGKPFKEVAGRNIVKIKQELQTAILAEIQRNGDLGLDIPQKDYLKPEVSEDKKKNFWWILVTASAFLFVAWFFGVDVQVPESPQTPQVEDSPTVRWDQDMSEIEPDVYGYARFRNGRLIQSEGYVGLYSCFAELTTILCSLTIDRFTEASPMPPSFWVANAPEETLTVEMWVDGELIETHQFQKIAGVALALDIESPSEGLIESMRRGLELDMRIRSSESGRTRSIRFSLMGFTVMEAFVSGLPTLDEQEAALKAQNPDERTFAEQQQEEAQESVQKDLELAIISEGFADLCSEQAENVRLQRVDMPLIDPEWYVGTVGLGENFGKELYSLNLLFELVVGDDQFVQGLERLYQRGEVSRSFPLSDFCRK